MVNWLRLKQTDSIIKKYLNVSNVRIWNVEKTFFRHPQRVSSLFDLMKKVPRYNFIPMLRANLPYRGHLVRPKSAWENVTVLTKKVQYAIERRTIKNSIEWKEKKNKHEPVQILKKISHRFTCAKSFQKCYSGCQTPAFGGNSYSKEERKL